MRKSKNCWKCSHYKRISTMGLCTEYGWLIMNDLAKTQRLCDLEMSETVIPNV